MLRYLRCNIDLVFDYNTRSITSLKGVSPYNRLPPSEGGLLPPDQLNNIFFDKGNVIVFSISEEGLGVWDISIISIIRDDVEYHQHINTNLTHNFMVVNSSEMMPLKQLAFTDVTLTYQRDEKIDICLSI